MSTFIVTVVPEDEVQNYVGSPDDVIQKTCDSCGMEGCINTSLLLSVNNDPEKTVSYLCLNCQGVPENAGFGETIYRQAMANWNGKVKVFLSDFELDLVRSSGSSTNSAAIQLALYMTTCGTEITVEDENFWANVRGYAGVFLRRIANHQVEIKKAPRYAFNPASMGLMAEEVPKEQLAEAVLDTVMLHEEINNLEHGSYLKWLVTKLENRL